MNSTKSKPDPDDLQWAIPVQPHAGPKLHDLTHDTNSTNCWCMPDLCQPCRKCGVQHWSDAPVDEFAVGDPDKLPLMEKFRAQADEHCPVCFGRGLEAEYDDELGTLIMHR